jgi:hypothetical protein
MGEQVEIFLRHIDTLLITTLLKLSETIVCGLTQYLDKLLTNYMVTCKGSI